MYVGGRINIYDLSGAEFTSYLIQCVLSSRESD